MFDDLEILCIRSSIIKGSLKDLCYSYIVEFKYAWLDSSIFHWNTVFCIFFILLVTEELLPNSLQLQNSRWSGKQFFVNRFFGINSLNTTSVVFTIICQVRGLIFQIFSVTIPWYHCLQTVIVPPYCTR